MRCNFISNANKTSARSIVIEDAIRDFQSGLGPRPAFFYCSRNIAEPERSDPDAVLASIARQLSSLEPGKPLLKPTLELYLKQEAQGFASGPPQLEESCSLILQLAEQYPLTIIVVDALDECKPRSRSLLLKALKSILQDSAGLVKIFVSSRNDHDIVSRLQGYPNLSIKSNRNSDDIATFVNCETRRLIEDGDLLQYSNSREVMKALIIEKVIRDASEM